MSNEPKNTEIFEDDDDDKKKFDLDKVITGILRYITTWGWLTVIVIYLIVSHWVCFVNSSGPSMEPTIHSGELLVCDRTCEIYTYDDIVVIQTDLPFFYGLLKRKLIKRIVGLPGDTLQVVEGVLYINGIAEDRDFPLIENPGLLSEPYTLEENMYFCMGDNRNNSADSRDYGAFSIEQLYGKVKINNKEN